MVSTSVRSYVCLETLHGPPMPPRQHATPMCQQVLRTAVITAFLLMSHHVSKATQRLDALQNVTYMLAGDRAMEEEQHTCKCAQHLWPAVAQHKTPSTPAPTSPNHVWLAQLHVAAAWVPCHPAPGRISGRTCVTSGAVLTGALPSCRYYGPTPATMVPTQPVQGPLLLSGPPRSSVAGLLTHTLTAAHHQDPPPPAEHTITAAAALPTNPPSPPPPHSSSSSPPPSTSA